jgi:hypothetical protein
MGKTAVKKIKTGKLRPRSLEYNMHGWHHRMNNMAKELNQFEMAASCNNFAYEDDWLQHFKTLWAAGWHKCIKIVQK